MIAMDGAQNGKQMKRVLYCKACGAPLTLPLTIVDEKAPGVQRPAMLDQQDIMPPGQAFVSHSRWWLSGCGAGHVYKAPEIWMNLGDLSGEPRYTQHTERLNGCCGLDGGDGPNRICRCGAHIGTELSDCFTPRMFIPDPATTEWKDAGE
jgi:hypothetical protein